MATVRLMSGELSAKARRHLRGMAHHLRPIVLVGKDGVSEELLGAARTALADHELIKVKLGENAGGDRVALAEAISTATGASQVGLIGRVLLLYKRHPKTPKIELPSEKKSHKSKRAS